MVYDNIDADDTNSALALQVIGEDNKNSYGIANISTLEVTYA